MKPRFQVHYAAQRWKISLLDLCHSFRSGEIDVIYKHKNFRQHVLEMKFLPVIISFHFSSLCYRLFITPFRSLSWSYAIGFPVLLYFTVQKMLRQVCQCHPLPENTVFQCQIAQGWKSCSVLKNTIFYTSCDFWAINAGSLICPTKCLRTGQILQKASGKL